MIQTIYWKECHVPKWNSTIDNLFNDFVDVLVLLRMQVVDVGRDPAVWLEKR